MNTTTMILIGAVIAFFLLSRRPTSTVASAPGMGYDPFGRPVPGPSYAVSPPTAAHSTVTDVLGAAGQIGFGIWDRLSNGSGGSSSSSLPPTLSDNSSAGLNLDSYV